MKCCTLMCIRYSVGGSVENVPDKVPGISLICLSEIVWLLIRFKIISKYIKQPDAFIWSWFSSLKRFQINRATLIGQLSLANQRSSFWQPTSAESFVTNDFSFGSVSRRLRIYCWLSRDICSFLIKVLILIYNKK